MTQNGVMIRPTIADSSPSGSPVTEASAIV
jgi:hypothetical protein